MEIVKNLGVRKSKTGNSYSSWAEFLCSFCGGIVERVLYAGLQAKSCGCKRNEFISQTRKELKLAVGENNPMYGIHRFGEEAPMYGKNHSNITKEKQSKKRIGKESYWKGKKLSKEIIKKIKENHADVKGDKNGNWQGGISFLPYAPEFNKPLKQSILERDDYICQCPDCMGKSKKLDIHHIDYDKKNNMPENLITLCGSCHTKTNGKNKRQYFTEYYQNIIVLK